MSTTGWTCVDPDEGLCLPTQSTEATNNTLGECFRTCRPRGRTLSWFVADSGLGVCKPTINPVSNFNNFPTAEICKQSALAHYSDLPSAHQPQGFICVNPELNQCIPTSNVNVPFTYQVYPTYQSCREAPECTPSHAQSQSRNGIPYLYR